MCGPSLAGGTGTRSPAARTIRPPSPGAKSWRQACVAANVWASMSVDAARHLVFLPTTSPSPDFYGGLRPGDNLYADSVVALNADTGEQVWSFQTGHHDLWDYDVASQPRSPRSRSMASGATSSSRAPSKASSLCSTGRRGSRCCRSRNGRPRRAALPAKRCRRPSLFRPICRRWVTTRCGRRTLMVLTPWDRDACAKAIAASRSEGRFTPAERAGNAQEMPFTGGGTGGGGVASMGRHTPGSSPTPRT